MDLLLNNTTLDAEITSNSSAQSGYSRDFYIYSIILPSVCFIGIVGNIANCITLQSPRLGAVSYMYLRALAISDLLCMLFVLSFVVLRTLRKLHYSHIAGAYVSAFYQAHMMLPLINWAISASTLVVVALTVERYISVCWPLYFRQWNSPRRASIAAAVAFMLPFMMYIPTCWDHSVVHWKVLVYNTSDSVQSTQLYRRAQSTLTHTEGFFAYKWSRETILKFVPIFLIAVLNLMIILAFRRHRELRRRIKAPVANKSASGAQRDNRSLLFLLTGIVVLFFISKIPAALNLVLINDERKKMPSYIIFRAMANLMEITNHALNFYIFCLCSADYRSTFLEKFPCVECSGVRSALSSASARDKKTGSFPDRDRKPETVETKLIEENLVSKVETVAEKPRFQLRIVDYSAESDNLSESEKQFVLTTLRTGAQINGEPKSPEPEVDETFL